MVSKLRFYRRQYIIISQFQVRWALLMAVIAAFASSLFAVPLYSSGPTAEPTAVRFPVRCG